MRLLAHALRTHVARSGKQPLARSAPPLSRDGPPHATQRSRTLTRHSPRDGTSSFVTPPLTHRASPLAHAAWLCSHATLVRSLVTCLRTLAARLLSLVAGLRKQAARLVSLVHANSIQTSDPLTWRQMLIKLVSKITWQCSRVSRFARVLVQVGDAVDSSDYLANSPILHCILRSRFILKSMRLIHLRDTNKANSN